MEWKFVKFQYWLFFGVLLRININILYLCLQKTLWSQRNSGNTPAHFVDQKLELILSETEIADLNKRRESISVFCHGRLFAVITANRSWSFCRQMFTTCQGIRRQRNNIARNQKRSNGQCFSFLFFSREEEHVRSKTMDSKYDYLMLSDILSVSGISTKVHTHNGLWKFPPKWASECYSSNPWNWYRLLDVMINNWRSLNKNNCSCWMFYLVII